MYCNSLSSINIPDSVTSIGDFAFAGCDSISPQVKSDIIQRFGEKSFVRKISGETEIKK